MYNLLLLPVVIMNLFYTMDLLSFFYLHILGQTSSVSYFYRLLIMRIYSLVLWIHLNFCLELMSEITVFLSVPNLSYWTQCQVHSCCCKWEDFIHFESWRVVYCVHVPHFHYSLDGWPTPLSHWVAYRNIGSTIPNGLKRHTWNVLPSIKNAHSS